MKWKEITVLNKEVSQILDYMYLVFQLFSKQDKEVMI